MLESNQKDHLLPSLAGRGWSLSFFFSLLLTLAACGGDGHRFKVEGKFKNLNQGEFWVYSTDYGFDRIDTIRLSNGRFSYDIPCENPTTLMLVFPNFSEQPVFAEPGKKASLRGDASNLKDLDVSGTKANELMTAFRRQTATTAPPEMKTAVEQFVGQHPESPVGLYLVKKYLLQAADADYKKAGELLTLMRQHQPKNGQIVQWQEKCARRQNTVKGGPIPTFTAKDINGRSVTEAAIKDADVAVVMAWASWLYDSKLMLRRLREQQQSSRGRLKVLSFYLDGNLREARQTIESDTIGWPVVFDTRFFDGEAIQLFGLTTVGDNIIYKNGHMVARGLKLSDLTDEVKKQLQ